MMELLNEFLSGSVAWGVLLTLATFALGALVNRVTGKAFFNPLLLGAIFVIVFLSVCGIPYADYKVSAAPVNYLLLPATVALAIPLYEKLDLLKANAAAIIAGISVGTLVSLGSALALALALHLTQEQYATLLPKSVTTAISMDVAAELGGIAALTGAIVIVTGIVGALLAETVCKMFHITDPIAKGVGIGTAAHAVGTAAASASPGSASAGHVWNALPGGRAATAHKACAAQSSHKRVVQRCFIRITSCFAQFTAVRWKNRAKGGGQSSNVLVYFFFSSGRDFCPPSCTPRRTQGWW